ncbi:MAG: hypothetical protein MSC31_12810 [Solirubrobacteraceae bacterium MAG38_C4-C5]|nr:hypothetical protein [Candidatus Siliceabacter maunaloa]
MRAQRPDHPTTLRLYIDHELDVADDTTYTTSYFARISSNPKTLSGALSVDDACTS